MSWREGAEESPATTPSSRIASAAYGAAALLLLVLGYSSTGATTASPRAGSELRPPPYVPAGGTRHLRSSDAGFGQVDAVIDLACQKSAAACPTLKEIVRNQRDQGDSVFHILLLSDNPTGYFAAKTVEVVPANADGTYDEVERFIDWVFRGQRIILDEQDTDVALDAQEVVTDWALSTSSCAEKLRGGMKNPAFDEMVLGDPENQLLLVVASTPTVLPNGIFMMHIGGEKQLQNFEAFLEGSECTSYDDIYTEDYDWLPLWKVEFARENRDSYGEMQRKRKGQQVAREQKKFERIEMRDQQGQLKQRQQLKQTVLRAPPGTPSSQRHRRSRQTG